MAERNGTGMFPREVMNRFPLLPLEEEGRLNDMPQRESFIERVFAYYRWTRMLDEEPTPGGLVPVPAVRAGKFHTAHKLTLMAHSPKHYTDMGRLVAQGSPAELEDRIDANIVIVESDQPRRVGKLLEQEDFVRSSTQIGNELRVMVKKTEPAPDKAVRTAIRNAGLHLANCSSTRPGLEDVFVAATRNGKDTS